MFFAEESASLRRRLQFLNSPCVCLPFVPIIRVHQDLRNRQHPVRASYRGDAQIYHASVVKLFYLAAVHRWLEDGQLQNPSRRPGKSARCNFLDFFHSLRCRVEPNADIAVTLSKLRRDVLYRHPGLPGRPQGLDDTLL